MNREGVRALVNTTSTVKLKPYYVVAYLGGIHVNLVCMKSCDYSYILSWIQAIPVLHRKSCVSRRLDVKLINWLDLA